MTTASQDAGRADARRNRVKVLAAAARAFDDHGIDVSLGEIARQAGVGAGTVYRHFPSKEILLEAVLVHQVDHLVDAARRWATRTTPVPAFFGFLLEVVDTSYGRKHACEAVSTDTSWPRPGLAASAQRFRQVLDELLRAAQKAAGSAPTSARMMSPRSLSGARRYGPLTATGPAAHGWCTWRWRACGNPERSRKSESFVTLPGCFTQRRGARCGARVDARNTGRPARYCGATCRQRAHRRRVAPVP